MGFRNRIEILKTFEEEDFTTSEQEFLASNSRDANVVIA